MKIKTGHLEHLRANIMATMEKYPNLIPEYEAGNFPRADKVKDLQKRFCFDLLYGAGLNAWVCSELYPYLNDSHVYTALKAVCPTVTRKY